MRVYFDGLPCLQILAEDILPLSQIQRILITYSRANSRATSILIEISLPHDSHERDGDGFGWISTHAKSCNGLEILSVRAQIFYALGMYACLFLWVEDFILSVSCPVKNSLEPRLMSISLIKGKCRKIMKRCLQHLKSTVTEFLLSVWE